MTGMLNHTYLIINIIFRTSAEIQQFIEGMDEVCGLWKYVKANPMTWLPLFCQKADPLTRQTFMDLCNIRWSEVGSNNRSQEEDTIYCWEVFLQEVNGK